MNRIAVSMVAVLLLLSGVVSGQDGGGGGGSTPPDEHGITGTALLSYDEDRNKMIGICITELDMDVQEYYRPNVRCSITDDTGTTLQSATLTGWGTAQVTLEVDAVADVNYTVTGNHYAEPFISDQAFESGHWVSYFYDFWNFFFFDQSYFTSDTPVVRHIGPGPPRQTPRSTLRIDRSKKQAVPTRPQTLRVMTWCPGGKGAVLEYWLMLPAGGRSRQGWVVVEHVNPSLASSEYGPGTTAQAGPPDGFEDDIGDVHGNTLHTGQTFTITTGLGKPYYDVTITWFGGAQLTSNSIDIVNGNQVTINGQATGTSCH
jgi:hypothetical protein